MRKDIKKSVGCDARSAELLDALAAEWGVSHAEAMRSAIWMAAGPWRGAARGSAA